MAEPKPPGNSPDMSLQRKTLLVVLLSVVVLLASVFGIARGLLLQGYRTLESEGQRRQVQRVVRALEATLAPLQRTVTDWAEWDDMYGYVQSPSEEFEKSNLVTSALRDLDCNYLIIADTQLKPVWQRGYSLADEAVAPVPPELMEALGQLPAIRDLTQDGVSGLMLLPGGVARVVARPILTSEQTGPARGLLVMARLFDAAELNRIREITDSEFTLAPLAAGATPLRPGQTALSNPTPDSLEGRAVLAGITGEPLALVTVTSPSSLYPMAQTTLRVMAIGLALCGLVVLVIVYAILSRLVFDRLARVSRAAETLAATGDLASRFPQDGPQDEVRQFAQALNRMLDGLEEAQRQLASSQQHYQALVDRLPQGLIVAHQINGTVLFANPAAADLTGEKSPAALVGRRVNELLTAESQKTWKGCLMRLGKPGARATVQVQLESSGQPRDVEVLASWSSHDGQDAFQLILTDITERLRLEEDQIRRDRLEAIGVLAGGMAHDFNNVLTVILGANALIETADGVPEELRKLVLESSLACDRARLLTHELLTFSHGGSKIPKLLDLRQFVTARVDMLMLDDALRCVLEIDEELPMVEADPDQLGQVIHNLVMNARQAMSSMGVITVKVTTVKVTLDQALPLRAGTYACIQVRDEGHGIDPEILPQIFDPYFTTRPGATGLGLSVAYAIMRRHGGHLGVESVEGRGSTFSVYLPESSGVRESTGETQTGMPRPRVRASGRLLIMDDDTPVRRMMQEILEWAGYRVIGTANGEAAVEQYQQAMQGGKPFDAVILDLMVIGGMGGVDTVNQLRQLDPQLRAIVSSGYTHDPVLAEPGRHGFDEMIRKPFHPGELLAVVEQVLGAGKGE